MGSQIAEHRPRVGVGLFDGRAGESNEERIGQGIAQVAGEAVRRLALLVHPPAKAVLRAVRFIRDHHDVLSSAECRNLPAALGHEFVDGSEDHATACPRDALPLSYFVELVFKIIWNIASNCSATSAVRACAVPGWSLITDCHFGFCDLSKISNTIRLSRRRLRSGRLSRSFWI